MLELKDITVERGGQPIVAGVSFDLAPGRLLAVLGPNGSGKTTLMRVIAGEWQPDDGVVLWQGRSPAEWGAREFARRRAVMAQDSVLNFPFTAEEVVLLGRTPHLHGVERPLDRELAAKAIAAVGLCGLEQRSYTTLSGGERRRVHLARVLCQIWQPLADDGDRLLLLDEPTAGLDLLHQHEALSLARDFAGRGVAVIAVVHDINLALNYADDVVVLHRGRLKAAGAAADVLTFGLIEEVFEVTAEEVSSRNGRRFLLQPGNPPITGTPVSER